MGSSFPGYQAPTRTYDPWSNFTVNASAGARASQQQGNFNWDWINPMTWGQSAQAEPQYQDFEKNTPKPQVQVPQFDAFNASTWGPNARMMLGVSDQEARNMSYGDMLGKAGQVYAPGITNLVQKGIEPYQPENGSPWESVWGNLGRYVAEPFGALSEFTQSQTGKALTAKNLWERGPSSGVMPWEVPGVVAATGSHPGYSLFDYGTAKQSAEALRQGASPEQQRQTFEQTRNPAFEAVGGMILDPLNLLPGPPIGKALGPLWKGAAKALETKGMKLTKFGDDVYREFMTRALNRLDPEGNITADDVRAIVADMRSHPEIGPHIPEGFEPNLERLLVEEPASGNLVKAQNRLRQTINEPGFPEEVKKDIILNHPELGPEQIDQLVADRIKNVQDYGGQAIVTQEKLAGIGREVSDVVSGQFNAKTLGNIDVTKMDPVQRVNQFFKRELGDVWLTLRPQYHVNNFLSNTVSQIQGGHAATLIKPINQIDRSLLQRGLAKSRYVDSGFASEMGTSQLSKVPGFKQAIGYGRNLANKMENAARLRVYYNAATRTQDELWRKAIDGTPIPPGLEGLKASLQHATNRNEIIEAFRRVTGDAPDPMAFSPDQLAAYQAMPDTIKEVVASQIRKVPPGATPERFNAAIDQAAVILDKNARKAASEAISKGPIQPSPRGQQAPWVKGPEAVKYRDAKRMGYDITDWQMHEDQVRQAVVDGVPKTPTSGVQQTTAQTGPRVARDYTAIHPNTFTNNMREANKVAELTDGFYRTRSPEQIAQTRQYLMGSYAPSGEFTYAMGVKGGKVTIDEAQQVAGYMAEAGKLITPDAPYGYTIDNISFVPREWFVKQAVGKVEGKSPQEIIDGILRWFSRKSKATPKEYARQVAASEKGLTKGSIRPKEKPPTPTGPIQFKGEPAAANVQRWEGLPGAKPSYTAEAANAEFEAQKVAFAQGQPKPTKPVTAEFISGMGKGGQITFVSEDQKLLYELGSKRSKFGAGNMSRSEVAARTERRKLLESGLSQRLGIPVEEVRQRAYQVYNDVKAQAKGIGLNEERTLVDNTAKGGLEPPAAAGSVEDFASIKRYTDTITGKKTYRIRKASGMLVRDKGYPTKASAEKARAEMFAESLKGKGAGETPAAAGTSAMRQTRRGLMGQPETINYLAGPEAAMPGFNEFEMAWNKNPKDAVSGMAKLLGLGDEGEVTNAKAVLEGLKQDYAQRISVPSGGSRVPPNELRAIRDDLLKQRQRISIDASKAGDAEAARVLRDYRMRNKLDVLLDHALPYHYWLTRNALFQIEYGMKNPVQAYKALQGLKMWADENKDLPQSMKYSIKAYTLPDGTEIRIKPLQMMFPFGQQAIEITDPGYVRKEQPDWATKIQSVMGAGAAPGIQFDYPTRLYQRAANEWNLPGKQQINDILGPQKDQVRALASQWDLIRAAGAKLGVQIPDPLEQMLYGTDISGYQEWNAKMRLAEGVKKGELTPEQALQAYIDQNDPNYKKALLETMGDTGVGQALRHGGLPVTSLSGWRKDSSALQDEYFSYEKGSPERAQMLERHPELLALWNVNKSPDEVAGALNETRYFNELEPLEWAREQARTDALPWDTNRREAEKAFGEQNQALREQYGLPTEDKSLEELSQLSMDSAAKRGDYLAVAWKLQQQRNAEGWDQYELLKGAKGYKGAEDKGNLQAQHGPVSAEDYAQEILAKYPDADPEAVRAALQGQTLPGMFEAAALQKPGEPDEEYAVRKAKTDALNEYYTLGTPEQEALAKQYSAIPKDTPQGKAERRQYLTEHPDLKALYEKQDEWSARNPDKYKAAFGEDYVPYQGGTSGYSAKTYTGGYGRSYSRSSGSTYRARGVQPSGDKGVFWDAYNALTPTEKAAARKDPLIGRILDKGTRAEVAPDQYGAALDGLNKAKEGAQVAEQEKTALTDSKNAFMSAWYAADTKLKTSLKLDPAIRAVQDPGMRGKATAREYQAALERLNEAQNEVPGSPQPMTYNEAKSAFANLWATIPAEARTALKTSDPFVGSVVKKWGAGSFVPLEVYMDVMYYLREKASGQPAPPLNILTEEWLTLNQPKQQASGGGSYKKGQPREPYQPSTIPPYHQAFSQFRSPRYRLTQRY